MKMQGVDGERGSEVSHKLNPYSEFQPALAADAFLTVPRETTQKFDGDAWKHSFASSAGDAESEELDYSPSKISKHALSKNSNLEGKDKGNQRFSQIGNIMGKPASPVKYSVAASMGTPVFHQSGSPNVQTKQKLQFGDVKPKNFKVPTLRMSQLEENPIQPSQRQPSLYGRREQNFKRNQQALINKYSSAVIICGLFMVCEIVGGLLCKSNAIIVDGVLKLSDICTFLVSILFLENKRKMNSYRTDSLDSSIVKGALFWLVVQFVAICFLIWRGVSMLSSQTKIEIKTDVMLVFACISLVCAYFTMYIHGYFQNQSCCVYDSIDQAQQTKMGVSRDSNAPSTKNFQTHMRSEETFKSNEIPNSVTHLTNQRKDKAPRQSGKTTLVKEVKKIKALRASAPMLNKHLQQTMNAKESPNEAQDEINIEQGDDMEQGLLYKEKDELSSQRVNIYADVDIHSQMMQKTLDDEIGRDYILSAAGTPRSYGPPAPNGNLLDQLSQITVAKNQIFLDMLQSLFLIVVCIAIQNHRDMAYLDPIFSFVMSFIMAMINLPVITNCISILLLNKPVLEVVKSKIEQLPEVSAITDIYIMQRTGGDEVLNVDVIAKRPDTQHKISIQQQVAKIARKSGLAIAVVQFK